jgi:hypothetical protein
MLLPTKGISFDRAILTIGADILESLSSPISVSGLWDRFVARRRDRIGPERVTFDWFSLALASLFAMGAIEVTPNNYLRRANVSS